MKFQSRSDPSVIVEAHQYADLSKKTHYHGSPFAKCPYSGKAHGHVMGVEGDPETERVCLPGDWIVHNADGSKAVVMPEVFAEKWEPVPEPAERLKWYTRFLNWLAG